MKNKEWNNNNKKKKKKNNNNNNDNNNNNNNNDNLMRLDWSAKIWKNLEKLDSRMVKVV